MSSINLGSIVILAGCVIHQYCDYNREVKLKHDMQGNIYVKVNVVSIKPYFCFKIIIVHAATQEGSPLPAFGTPITFRRPTLHMSRRTRRDLLLWPLFCIATRNDTTWRYAKLVSWCFHRIMLSAEISCNLLRNMFQKLKIHSSCEIEDFVEDSSLQAV